MPQTKAEPTREIATARKTITEQERQLTVSAFSQYKSGEYEDCLKNLRKLLELRQHDARVFENIALVEYYLSNLCKTDEFLKQLNSAKKQLEFGMVNTGDELDDIDRCFLLYNEAVLNFHMKQYSVTINILERLFKIIEPLGDILAAKVCVLLTDAYLLNYQLEQAHGMVTYIESVILAQKSSTDELHEEQSNYISKTFQPCLHMFKVRLFMMRGFYNQSKKELKLAMYSSNNSVEALYLKANVESLRGNYEKSMKLLNTAPKNLSFKETGHAIVPMFYNDMACIYFAQKKYNLAALYSKKALEENMAVMKALSPMEKYNSLSGRPLQTLSLNRKTEMLYNMGVSLLFAGKPNAAFECLMQGQTKYQCNPRYWLRLAECCVTAAHKARNAVESGTGRKASYIRGVIGTGVHRKIVLSPFHHNRASKRDGPFTAMHDGQSAAMPAVTLEFANLCLTNAMLLLPSQQQLEKAMTTYLENEHVVPGDVDKEPVKRSFLGRIFVDVPPGEPIQTKQAYYLRGSILCCHGYVSLGIADYHKCLTYCDALLRMTHLPAHHKFVAHLYRIEALIKLDRVNQAVQELSAENFKSFASINHDLTGLKISDGFPGNLNEARNQLMMNVASAYCVRSDFEKCKQVLRQVVSTDLPTAIRSRAVLLSVYCHLRLGQVQSALNLIKRNEVFSSGRLIDRVEAARAMQQPQAVITNMSDRRATHQPVGFPSVATSGSAGGGITHPPPGMSFNFQPSTSFLPS